jgi:hypothetical protein
MQTLTIHTTPKYYMSFDTQYSDGKDGMKYGGWGYGQMPASGTYVSSWVVVPNASLGEAIVYVGVSGVPKTTGFRQPTFNVASSC